MLTIRNLKCYYGKIMAVKGVSLSVAEGEFVTLIGANGAGKSTLLEAVCGLLESWDGDIVFDGTPIRRIDPPEIVKLGISMVPEGRLIFPPLSVLDNLKLGAYIRYRKNEDDFIKDDIERMFTLFPVLKERAKKPAGGLSGGEQQMLAIARALMAKPRLLVLDEPSMGLAPIIVGKIFDILRSLHSQGLTILLVEQNARAALKLADRGYVMETGKIVLDGAAEDLLSDEDVKRAYLGQDYSDFCDGRE